MGTAGPAAGPLLGYLTDVEGDYQHWRRYVGRSRVLRPDPAGGSAVLLAEGCEFVYGGDSRRRDCHFADAPCVSLLKHLMKVHRYREVPSNDSLADG